MTTPITPTLTLEGSMSEVSIKDLIADMKDPLKVVHVEVIEYKSVTVLNFDVDGYTVFNGDMAYLYDYTPQTVKEFYATLSAPEWKRTAFYGIERIGHKTLPPMRIRHQKWERL